MPPQTPPLHVLLDSWTQGQSAPALTWYGTDGERVELSGRVLANWVTKAANLLVDEADVGPGSVVQLDLPMHWRTVVWALAAWVCGATVTLPDDGESRPGADVLVSTAPAPAGAPVRIAVALPALAREVADLPEGAVDGAAELMAQPDLLVTPPDWDGDALALGDLRHAALADPATVQPGLPRPGRYLLPAGRPTDGLRTALAVWLGGGSIVLVGDEDADTARIQAQEGAVVLAG